MIFRGLSVLAAKPRLIWDGGLEGAGKNEPVKVSFLCFDSGRISQGEHGHEMKGRGQEVLTTMSEMALLGSFGVSGAQGPGLCSPELLPLALPLSHIALFIASSEFKVLTKEGGD